MQNISEKENKAVTIWLFTLIVLIMIMVVFGGYVRLTRSGLSLVEWHPISGVIPPITDAEWEVEFGKYKETPEFQIINAGMDVEGFKEIFYLEYIHRVIARLVGLVVALPLFYFWWKKIIPWRESGVYVLIALLFLFQAFLGWYMVSSGLVDHPEVSHLRLTFHLLTALLLLGITTWAAFDHMYRFPAIEKKALKSKTFIWSVVLMGTLVFQIMYGGFMAGLKAGHVSSTYPLIYGKWIPSGMLSAAEPWWSNLWNTPLTVHFTHRWFAIIVLAVSFWLYWSTRHTPHSKKLHKGIFWMLILTLVQITLGVITIWYHVPIFWASLHQATALSLFTVTIFINYQVVHEPVPDPVVQDAGEQVTA